MRISALFMLLLSIGCAQTYPQGENLYITYCANCHMADGSGLERLIPTLRNADYLTLHADKVPCIIRNGNDTAILVDGILYTEPMPSFTNLNAVEISNIINYIHTSWGNALPATNPTEVQSALDACD